MTCPPARATVPSARTSVTPITRSRTAPYRSRRGPKSPVANRPPTVAPPPSVGGSSANHCPSLDSCSWSARNGMPASTRTVMSAGLWLSSRHNAPVSRTRPPTAGVPPQAILVPPPRKSTVPVVSRSTWAASPTLDGRSTPAPVGGAAVVVVTCRPAPRPRAPSEPLDDTTRLQRMWPPRPGTLAAQPRGGQYLARVADPVRVERRPDRRHHGEIGLGEHLRHRAGLVAADTVLAGDRPALLDAHLDDRGGQVLGPLGLPGNRCVVQDERMEVAVAGMEHVRDAEAGFLGHLPDPGQRGAQLRAGDDAVLHEIVGAHAAHGGEGRLATLPDEGTLVGSVRDADLRGPVGPADFLDALEPGLHLRGHPVELHHERGRATDGVAGPGGPLARLDREGVEHLHRGRDDAGRDDVADGVARVPGGGEVRDQGANGLRPAQQPHRHLGDDAERPLRADDQGAQVGPDGVQRVAAEGEDRKSTRLNSSHVRISYAV